MRAAVIFVGNRLMRDDGVGAHAYDAFTQAWDVPAQVDVREVGCMTLDLLPLVDASDVIITVDAVDGTGLAPGTVVKFSPDDMARHGAAEVSLHDLRLVDLFDAAALLGYTCEGVCLGMQVLDADPREYDLSLTPVCEDALALLVDTIAAELAARGFAVRRRDPDNAGI